MDDSDSSTPAITALGVALFYVLELGSAAAGRLAQASTTSCVFLEPTFPGNPAGVAMTSSAKGQQTIARVLNDCIDALLAAPIHSARTSSAVSGRSLFDPQRARRLQPASHSRRSRAVGYPPAGMALSDDGIVIYPRLEARVDSIRLRALRCPPLGLHVRGTLMTRAKTQPARGQAITTPVVSRLRRACRRQPQSPPHTTQHRPHRPRLVARRSPGTGR